MYGTCASTYICTLSSFVHMHAGCASIVPDKKAEKEEWPSLHAASSRRTTCKHPSGFIPWLQTGLKSLDAISTTGRAAVPAAWAAWPEVSGLVMQDQRGFIWRLMDFCWGGPQTIDELFSLFFFFCKWAFRNKTKKYILISPKIALYLADDYILETSMSGWEGVPSGFAGLPVCSSSQQ